MQNVVNQDIDSVDMNIRWKDKYDTVDGNNLLLSNYGASPYLGVAVVTNPQLEDTPYAAIVHVPVSIQDHFTELQDKFGDDRKRCTLFLGYYGDPRQAAYIAQTFEADLQSNLRSFIDNGFSWETEMPELPEFGQPPVGKKNEVFNTQPRMTIPKKEKLTLTVQSAMSQAWKDGEYENLLNYKLSPGEIDMLRKEIEKNFDPKIHDTNTKMIDMVVGVIETMFHLK